MALLGLEQLRLPIKPKEVNLDTSEGDCWLDRQIARGYRLDATETAQR
jgi:hypothetical protein